MKRGQAVVLAGTLPGWSAGWTNRAARGGSLPIREVQYISGQFHPISQLSKHTQPVTQTLLKKKSSPPPHCLQSVDEAGTTYKLINFVK